jgi:hypothetical protein
VQLLDHWPDAAHATGFCRAVKVCAKYGQESRYFDLQVRFGTRQPTSGANKKAPLAYRSSSRISRGSCEVIVSTLSSSHRGRCQRPHGSLLHLPTWAAQQLIQQPQPANDHHWPTPPPCTRPRRLYSSSSGPGCLAWSVAAASGRGSSLTCAAVAHGGAAAACVQDRMILTL